MDLYFMFWNVLTVHLLVYDLVIDSVEVGKEALMVPPAPVRDLGTDVSCVWSAEALLVVIPAKRVLNRTAESWDMETVVVVLILNPAKARQEFVRKSSKCMFRASVQILFHLKLKRIFWLFTFILLFNCA